MLGFMEFTYSRILASGPVCIPVESKYTEIWSLTASELMS